jgi:hypothetical protein
MPTVSVDVNVKLIMGAPLSDVFNDYYDAKGEMTITDFGGKSLSSLMKKHTMLRQFVKNHVHAMRENEKTERDLIRELSDRYVDSSEEFKLTIAKRVGDTSYSEHQVIGVPVGRIDEWDDVQSVSVDPLRDIPIAYERAREQLTMLNYDGPLRLYMILSWGSDN